MERGIYTLHWPVNIRMTYVDLVSLINFSQLFVLAAVKIDASVYPIFVPWYNDVSVKKDPLPSDHIVDLELLENLDNSRTLIRKYPDTFLCLVGLIRSFTDPTARPTLICCEKSDMKTADAVFNPSPQTICLVTHTIVDEINLHSGKNKRKVGASYVLPPMKKARMGGVSVVTTVGKSLLVIRKLIKQANVDSGTATSHVEEFMYSFVTPTTEHDCEDESVLNHGDNVRTCPPGRYVVLSSSSADTDNLNSPQVVQLVPSVQANTDVVATEPPGATHDSSVPMTEVGRSSTIDSATAQNIYVPNWNVTNSARMNDLVMCRNLWIMCLRQGIGLLFLRLRYEHEITVREKFEKKFIDSSEVIQQRDAEIVELRSKLRKAEDEAADVVDVRGKVYELETVAAGRVEELASLSVYNVELSGQVEGEAKLKEQFMAMQDDAVQCLIDRNSALDARLSELSCQVDSELYPHMLTAVAGRRWVIGHGLRLAFMKCCESVEYQTALGKVVSLAIDQGIQQGLEAGIDHSKAGRDLSMVEAYDLGVKTQYEEELKELENVSLLFLARLESYKDSPLELGGSHVPGMVCCEVPLEGALKASRAHAQKHKRVESSSLVTVLQDQGTSTSHAATVTPLNSVTVDDYTSSDVIILQTVAAFGPHNLSFIDNQQEYVHNDMFDTTLLDKPAEP
ncbi:hypothetical protein Tco_0729803 [Tanacetum coccineum]|uniref:Transposase (Putative), gypsy type n=1 Tax=Tanacetum coccineum TaxID=301880 RepID=A0ABQ4YQT9_9ASTR